MLEYYHNFWAKNRNSDGDRRRDRLSWGANPAKDGLDALNMPILTVIVTQTYDNSIDEPGRCNTEVSLVSHSRMKLINFSRMSASGEFNCYRSTTWKSSPIFHSTF